MEQDASSMRNIVSGIMDGIVFLDTDATVKLVNSAAEDLLGVKSFMVIGKRLAELPDLSELTVAIKDDSAKLESRDTSRIVEVHDSEQDLLYIRLRVSRVLDYRGESGGTLVVLQDVTAEHKTDQLKNQYLSIVAHELRTPLTGIKTFSSLMSKGSLGPLNDKQVRVIDSIREQSLRLEHQIDKLINLGHIDSNEYGQDLEVFDIRDLMAQVTEPFEQPAKDRGIRIELSVPDDPIEVDGDRADLKRAIQTLIENAVKFCPDDGQVWVQASRVDDSVAFSVRDDGPGIDPRYHRRVFEKFFQVEDPLTRHHGGAGLGLFFVGRIVKAHGSDVSVDSQLGSGATFSFVLPIHRSPELTVMSSSESVPDS